MSGPRKLVVVSATFDMLLDVPKDWDEDMVNFYLNESSFCLGTLVKQLADEEGMAPEGCCFTCARASAEYLREADAVDVEELTPEKHPRRKVEQG